MTLPVRHPDSGVVQFALPACLIESGRQARYRWAHVARGKQSLVRAQVVRRRSIGHHAAWRPLAHIRLSGDQLTVAAEQCVAPAGRGQLAAVVDVLSQSGWAAMDCLSSPNG